MTEFEFILRPITYGMMILFFSLHLYFLCEAEWNGRKG